MRLHLSRQSLTSAVSIAFVAILLGLGNLAPGAVADVLSPSVDDGGSGHAGESTFTPLTQDERATIMAESKETAGHVVVTMNSHQIQMIEEKAPNSRFAAEGDSASAYCYRCFSYR